MGRKALGEDECLKGVHLGTERPSENGVTVLFLFGSSEELQRFKTHPGARALKCQYLYKTIRNTASMFPKSLSMGQILEWKIVCR